MDFLFYLYRRSPFFCGLYLLLLLVKLVPVLNQVKNIRLCLKWNILDSSYRRAVERIAKRIWRTADFLATV